MISPVSAFIWFLSAFFPGTTVRTNWFVTANLEMKGLDIHKEVRVNIG